MVVAHRIEKSEIIRQNNLTKAVDIDKTFGLVLPVLMAAFIASLVFIGRLLSRDGERQMRSRTILEHLLGFRVNRKNFTKFALVLAFFRLELFFCKILFANSIKTNTIVLETSHFITSLQQLLGSNKYLVCFFQNHILYQIAIESDPNSILNRLYVEKSNFVEEDKLLVKTDSGAREPKKCVFNLSKLGKNPVDWTGKAFFVNSIIANLVLKSHTVGQTGDYWLSPPMLDLIAVNYQRAGLPPDQRVLIHRL